MSSCWSPKLLNTVVKSRTEPAMSKMLGENGGCATEQWGTTVKISALISLKIMNRNSATTTEIKLYQIKVSSVWRCHRVEVAHLMFRFSLCRRPKWHNCHLPCLAFKESIMQSNTNSFHFIYTAPQMRHIYTVTQSYSWFLKFIRDDLKPPTVQA